MLFSVCQPSLQSAGIEVRSPQTCPIPGKQPREKIYSGTFIISFVSFDLCDLACFRNLSAQTQGSQNVPFTLFKISHQLRSLSNFSFRAYFDFVPTRHAVPGIFHHWLVQKNIKSQHIVFFIPARFP